MRFRHTEPDPEKLLTTSKLYYTAYRLYSRRITLHQTLLEFAAWVDQDFREDIARAPYSRKLLFFLTWILARALLSGYRSLHWLFFERIVMKVLVPYLLLPFYSFITLKWVRLLFSPKELRRQLLSELQKELENRGFSPTKNRSGLSFRERAELLVFDLFYHLAGLSELSRKDFFERSRKTIFLLTSLALHLLVLFTLNYQKPSRYDLSEGEILDLDSIELVEIGARPSAKKRKKPGIAKRQTPAAKLLKKIARLKPKTQLQPKAPTPSRERITHEPKPPPVKKPPTELERKIAVIKQRTIAMIKKPPGLKTERTGRKYRRPGFKPKKIMPRPAQKSPPPQKSFSLRKIAPGKVASARKIRAKTPAMDFLTFPPTVDRAPAQYPGSSADKASQVFKRETGSRQIKRLLPSVITERQAGNTTPETTLEPRKSRVVIRMTDIGRRRVDLSRDKELTSKRFELSRLNKTDKKLAAARLKLDKSISRMSLEESLARKTLDSGSMLQRETRPKEKLLVSQRKDSDFKLDRSEHAIKDQSEIGRSRKFQGDLLKITGRSETLENRLPETFPTEAKRLQKKAPARKPVFLNLSLMEGRSGLPVSDTPRKRLSSSAARRQSRGFSRQLEADDRSVRTMTALTPGTDKQTREITYEEFEKYKKAISAPEITIENPGNEVEAGNSSVTYLASTGKQSFSAVETRDNLRVGVPFQPEAVSAAAPGKAELLADGFRIAETRGKTLALADKSGEQALEKLLESPGVGRPQTLADTKSPRKRKMGSMKIDLNLPSGMITKEALFTLTGRMDKETKVAWIKVNGITQLAAVLGGRLVAELTMKKGINEIEVTAFSSSGAFGGKKVKILFQPPRQVPVITLISPPIHMEKAEKGQVVLVKGEVNDPRITRAVLFLNRRPVMLSVKGGKFSKKVVLPGKRLNTFRVMATNGMGVKGYSPLHTVLVGASIDVMNPRPF